MTDNSGPGGSQLYYDVDTFEEVQIEMNSHSAEVQTRGDQIQSDSVDEDLRSRGVDRASSLDQYLDTGLDLGGPIARDRVWFWGALRGQEIERFVTGTRNPDGSFPIDRTFLWYPSAKIDRRAADAHRVSGFFNMQQKKRFNSGLSAPRPLETTVNQMNNPISRLVSLRDDWTMSPRLLISLKANYLMGAFQTRALPGVDTANTPARLELSINAWSEAPPSTITSGRETWTVGGTGNYSASGWGGTHDVKFGVEFNRMEAPVEFGYPADHRLRFLDGQPLEVWLFSPGRQNSVVHARSGEVNVPAGAAVVDAAGKWLIPGLMNMHVHLGLALPGRAGSELAGESDAELVLRMAVNARKSLHAGVTTVRLPGDRRHADLALKRTIERGDFAGPRIISAGESIPITGGHGSRRGETYDGPYEIRREVRRQIAAGSEWTKIAISGGIATPGGDIAAALMTRDEMEAVTDIARRHAVKVTAHSGSPAATLEAIEAGVNCIEHGYFLTREVFQKMKAGDVWYVPTIVVSRPATMEFFERIGSPPWYLERVRSVGKHHWEALRTAIQVGVRIALGTDQFPYEPNDGTTATVREAEYYVKAGMTPLQALRSATIETATLLELAPDVGTLEPGKFADVVGVDADPIKDISALRTIGFVMKDGKIVRNDWTAARTTSNQSR